MLLVSYLTEICVRTESLIVVSPMAAFLSFPSYRLEIDSWKLCEMLVAKPYHTAAIPGIAYGMEQIGKLISDLS